MLFKHHGKLNLLSHNMMVCMHLDTPSYFMLYYLYFTYDLHLKKSILKKYRKLFFHQKRKYL